MVWLRSSDVILPRSPTEKMMRRVISSPAMLLSPSLLLSRLRLPNKAPEPTPPSVTPRASESVFEMTPQNVIRSDARGAPAGVVAHL